MRDEKVVLSATDMDSACVLAASAFCFSSSRNLKISSSAGGLKGFFSRSLQCISVSQLRQSSQCKGSASAG